MNLKDKVYDFSKFVCVLNVSLVTLLIAAGEQLATFSQPSWQVPTIAYVLMISLAGSLFSAYSTILGKEEIGYSVIKWSSMMTFGVIFGTVIKAVSL